MRRRFTDFLTRLRKGDADPEHGRLAAVLELNRALAGARDRRAVLTLLVDAAVQLFGAERGFLVLTRAESPGFGVEVARSLDREPVLHPERKVSSTVVRRALEEGEGVFSEDAQEDELGAAGSIADLKLRSVLCTPLLAGDQPIGCIYLDHRFQARAFRSADLPWLQAFADQGAIAVHLHGLLADNEAWAKRVAARNQELEAEVAARAEQLNALGAGLSRQDLGPAFDEIVGESPALLSALHQIAAVAAAEFPVLITGESGTGKELSARALAAASRRAAAPFVAVNVAAIPPALLESELFGHVRGAFTGADRDRKGLLREADSGVLFLDEVTEMGPDVQAKLLRFLEGSRMRPLGGDREMAVDLRVVAATNRDPLEAVAAGRLREDLYYRLAGATVRMPPLRERSGDLPRLAQHFLETAARARGGAAKSLPADVTAVLVRRRWRGNLRQLRNEIQRLDAMAGTGEISAALLEREEPGGADPKIPDSLALADVERWAIQRAMDLAGGNKAEAARLLGVSRRTLYNKLGRDPV